MTRPLPASSTCTVGAEMAQHVLGVVARRPPALRPRVIARRVQPGQQHRRLHLGRGDRQAVFERQRLGRAAGWRAAAGRPRAPRSGRRRRTAARSPGASAAAAGWHRRSSRANSGGRPARRTAAARRCRSCPCRARRPAPPVRRRRGPPPASPRPIVRHLGAERAHGRGGAQHVLALQQPVIRSRRPPAHRTSARDG